MKTIIFDFDGTLTKKSHEIWQKIWKYLDALDIDNILYNKFYNKEITYDEWAKEIEKEYVKRNLTKEQVLSLTKEIELMDHLEETLKILKNDNNKLYIVSGGIDTVIYSKLGDLVKYFDGIYCCEFKYDKEGKLTTIVPTKYDEEGKKNFIEEYCLNNKVEPQDILFIGNGNNDEYVYLSGCHTICINPEKKTKHQDNNIWHKVIYDTTDMSDILKYVNLKRK